MNEEKNTKSAPNADAEKEKDSGKPKADEIDQSPNDTQDDEVKTREQIADASRNVKNNLW